MDGRRAFADIGCKPAHDSAGGASGARHFLDDT